MNISTLQTNLDFIKSLYFHEEWKDEDCRDRILEALEECNDKIEQAFGYSLHRVGGEHKPSVEAVEKVVKKFPSTLSYEDEKGRIPIQRAAAYYKNGFEYVPVLAKEGVKYEVGGEDARGGLLALDPYDEDRGCNTLHWLVGGIADGDNGAKRLNVLKELRKMGLLVKRDIKEQALLWYTCDERCKERFEYLVDWDPDALIETRVQNKPLIHSLTQEDYLFPFLKAGFDKHPNIGGLLFIEDDQGTTALDTIFNRFGKEKVMEILHEILSPDCDYPILHHVFVKAPQHKGLFMDKFPWAYHLKDHNGRAIHQAVLAAGPDIMDKNLMFASLTDDQIQTQDPINILYPFAVMAVGEHADLEKIFYLLRRQPSVMERHSRS